MHILHILFNTLKKKTRISYWGINNLGKIFLTSFSNPHSDSTTKAFINLTKTERIIRKTINFLANKQPPH